MHAGYAGIVAAFRRHFAPATLETERFRMWDYYKRTFLAVQLATGVVSWMVYRASNHLWAPTAVFVISMQTSALFGAMWANRLRRKLRASTSCLLN